MKDFAYGFQTQLHGVSLEESITRIRKALQKEGFGILNEVDIKETFRKKLDMEFRPYKILGACNPSLAKQALEQEPNIGLLLPCNIIVQEVSKDTILIATIDPLSIFQVVGKSAILPIAREVKERLRRVIRTLDVSEEIENLERNPSEGEEIRMRNTS